MAALVHGRRALAAIVLGMVPLAAAGTAIIAVAVAGAILLVVILFRAEDRYEAEDRARRSRQTGVEPPGEHRG